MVGSPWIGGGASGKAASISALSVGFRVAMMMYLVELIDGAGCLCCDRVSCVLVVVC